MIKLSIVTDDFEFHDRNYWEMSELRLMVINRNGGME